MGDESDLSEGEEEDFDLASSSPLETSGEDGRDAMRKIKNKILKVSKKLSTDMRTEEKVKSKKCENTLQTSEKDLKPHSIRVAKM